MVVNSTFAITHNNMYRTSNTTYTIPHRIIILQLDQEYSVRIRMSIHSFTVAIRPYGVCELNLRTRYIRIKIYTGTRYPVPHVFIYST